MGTKPVFFFCTPHGNQTWLFSAHRMGTKPGYFLHSAWELNLVIFCTPHGNQTWLFSALCVGTKPGYFLHTAWEPNLVIFFTLHRNLCQTFVTTDVPTSCYSWGSTQEPSSATPNAQKKVKRGFRQMKLNGPRRLKSERNCWQCEKHPAQKKS